MPYHTGSNTPKMPKMPKKKEPEKKQELTSKQMDKLREHAKMHKGGMRSKHMRNMVKFMKEGMSFTKAHNKAIKQ